MCCWNLALQAYLLAFPSLLPSHKYQFRIVVFPLSVVLTGAWWWAVAWLPW